MRRAACVTAKAARRKSDTTSTGPSARRVSELAPRMRHATLAVTAANRATVRISRSGRTTFSTNAGSLSTSMNALPGHASPQSAQGVGTG